MKKICLSFLVISAISFQYCASSKKAKVKAVPKMTYIANIEPIISATCAPCHIPGKGNKTPYNTYASVKTDIDEIINRIHRNPGEKGFMPQRRPKLSADTINIFAQWKADGMLEK